MGFFGSIIKNGASSLVEKASQRQELLDQHRRMSTRDLKMILSTRSGLDRQVAMVALKERGELERSDLQR